MADVTFLVMFGSQTASSVKAGMEWTRWVGTPLSAFVCRSRRFSGSPQSGRRITRFEQHDAFVRVGVHDVRDGEYFVVVVVQAGKVSYG